MDMNLLRQMAGDPMWDAKHLVAQLGYRFPLPLDRDMTEIGTAIGNIAPPDRTIYQMGPFMMSKSPESHIGPFKHAVDFLVPDGTQILAAADGRVHELSLQSQKWGPSEESAGFLNYITILHEKVEDGCRTGYVEYSQYCHVAFPSRERPQLVQLGDRVEAGQPISYVEKNGWTDRDHLHFMVFRGALQYSGNPFGFESLRVTFR